MSQPQIFLVDTEATNKTPYSGVMTEFGIVHLDSRKWFHGHLFDSTPHPDIPALPVVPDGAAPNPWMQTTGIHEPTRVHRPVDVYQALRAWLAGFPGRPMFVSDNPAFDWQWIADGFDRNGLDNPFGHSARRIGDFAAGLDRNWRNASAWKRLRKTRHDHNPVNDSLGNAEALATLLQQSKRPGGRPQS